LRAQQTLLSPGRKQVLSGNYQGKITRGRIEYHTGDSTLAASCDNQREAARGIKGVVCYVPQEEILLRCFTAREVLTYVAALRLPPGTDAPPIIAAVLDLLNLKSKVSQHEAERGGTESKGP
jgi:ABC-type multidrug transport system ATPase subunit